MKIVFCTTCKGRVQHIMATLPKNLKDNDSPDVRFVLLDYHDQTGLHAHVRNNHIPDINSGRLVVYHYFGDEPFITKSTPFKMAHAKNIAHRCGILEGADVLINLDADNLTGPGFADYLRERFSLNGNQFMYAKWRDKPRIPKGTSGRIAVTSKAFIKAGGYDEKYDTWGPDDKDFSARLRRLGYDPCAIDPQYLQAILHTDKMRFREYPHARRDSYRPEDPIMRDPMNDLCDTTISNFGQFGMGTVFRNFDAKPIVLGPVPTRIFGIGMHKTATTSLNAALKILGIESAHWENAHWARAIWDEMTATGRSKTVERAYALSDLPIPVLYREVDKAYPGSKFILTVRDEESWIESVRKHWSHEHNPFRGQWGSDPFTHRVHKIVYGQKGFNAENFLARYRQHNDDVRAYFRDRPGDLLEMQMKNGAGWKELCGFLRRSIPSVPYPRKFVTSSNNTCEGGSHI